MRHRTSTHSFGRRQGPRKALIRGLVDSLVEHGRIRTTVAKAKELRRHVERAVTMGKKGTVHARRLLLSRFPNPSTVATLVDDLGPRFKDRNGGYTRIIKAGHRPGDAADMALIEFVDYELPQAGSEVTVKAEKQAKSAKKKAGAKKEADKAEKAEKPEAQKMKSSQSQKAKQVKKKRKAQGTARRTSRSVKK